MSGIEYWIIMTISCALGGYLGWTIADQEVSVKKKLIIAAIFCMVLILNSHIEDCGGIKQFIERILDGSW